MYIYITRCVQMCAIKIPVYLSNRSRNKILEPSFMLSLNKYSFLLSEVVSILTSNTREEFCLFLNIM